MVKSTDEVRNVLSPGLKEAPVLDRMCSQFVLSLTMRQPGRFNLRRDWNSLLSLTGRHLVWPVPVFERVRAFLAQRCRSNEAWRGHEVLSHGAFMARHGEWRGPYEEGTLFFYIDEYIKDAPKDLLAVLGTTAQWLNRSLKKESTLVEKNIDALAGLLQLNPAERALLLYGTLARYQRDLRGLLVEFKVSNAQEAYAAIAEVAGVNEAEVAEALRAGSRLERIGMVENLISEHNITDLADLMKVSEQLPPVLMRRYEGPSDLMAVFTRPAARTELCPGDFHYVAEDLQVLTALLRNAVAGKEPGVNVLLYGPPGTGKTELAKVAAQAAGLSLYEVEYADRDGNSLVRARPLPILADQPGVPEGQCRCGAAVRRGGGRLPADLHRHRPDHGAPGHGRRRAQRQCQRQGLGQPDPGNQPGAGGLGDQPHRADRPRLSAPIPVSPGAQEPATGCPRGFGPASPGRCESECRLFSKACRTQRVDTCPGAHCRALCPPGQCGAIRLGGGRPRRAPGRSCGTPDRATARSRRPRPGQRRGRTRCAAGGHRL